MLVAGRHAALALALLLALLAPGPASCGVDAFFFHGFFAGQTPFSRLNADGGPEGLCPALMDELAGAARTKVSHMPLRQEMAQDFLHAGIIDLYFSFVETGAAPPKGLAFGEAVLESPLAVVSWDGKLAGDAVVFSPRTVGVVEGSWEEQVISAMRTRLHGRCRVRSYPSRDALINELSRRRIASALVPACTAGTLKAIAGGVAVSGPLQDWGLGMLVPVFREDDVAGRARFAKMLDRLRQSQDLHRLLQLWLPEEER